MIAAIVSRFAFQVAPRMGSPEVCAGRLAGWLAAWWRWGRHACSDAQLASDVPQDAVRMVAGL